MSKRNRWMIGMAVLVLLGSAGGFAVWKLLQKREAKAEVASVATQFPKDTAVMAWSVSLEELFAMADAVGLSSQILSSLASEYREMVTLLGADPLTREGMTSLGLDLKGVPSLGYVPAPGFDGTLLVRLPMLPDKSGIAAFKGIREKFKDEAEFILDEVVVAEHPVVWVKEEAAGPIRGAVLDLPGCSYVLAPLNPSNRKAELEGAEVQRLVKDLASPQSERLDKVTGFAEVTQGLGRVLVGIYVTGDGLVKAAANDRDLAQMLAGFSEMYGMVGYLQEDGGVLRLGMKAYSREAQQIVRTRDLEVLKKVPGSPLMGLHMALDAAALMKSMEKGLASQPELYEEYARGKREAVKELGLPDGAELQDYWDGEFGLFVGDFAASPEYMSRQFLVFLGVKDEAKLTAWATQFLAKYMNEIPLSVRNYGSVVGYVFTQGPVSVGAMISDHRLWIAGDLSWLDAIAKGEQGKLFDGERSRLIARSMGLKSPMVFYMDLKKPITLLSAAMGSVSRGDDMEQRAWAMASRLDFVEYESNQEGPLSWGVLTLTLDLPGLRDDFRNLLGTGIQSYLAKAQIDRCRAQLWMVRNGVDMYYYEHDEYPADLVTLTRPQGDREPVLRESYLTDPWGNPFVFTREGDEVKLCSHGPDGVKGSPDDLCHGNEDDL